MNGLIISENMNQTV